MGQTYNKGSAVDYALAKTVEKMHVKEIQYDRQGNIIFDEFELKARSSKKWQALENKYGINYGDVVKIDIDSLGRVQELSVTEGLKDNYGHISDRLDIKLYGGLEMEDLHCAEVGKSAKEFLQDIKVQPQAIQPKERKLSIKEKLKNTIQTKVKTFKQGGAAQRLAKRRANSIANGRDASISR